MNTAIQQTIKHWGYLIPYTHVPRNKAEYEKLLSFVDELMEFSRHKKDARVTSFLKLIAQNIETYETHHYPSKSVSPVERDIEHPLNEAFRKEIQLDACS